MTTSILESCNSISELPEVVGTSKNVHEITNTTSLWKTMDLNDRISESYEVVGTSNKNSENIVPTLKEVMEQKTNTSPINVVVRFRPLLGDEIKRQDKEIIRSHKILKSKKMVLNVKAEKKVKDFRGREKRTVLFKGSGFSSILETNDNNKNTFNKCIAPLLPNVMNGNISSCFCYGQTGSGKTHTTLGYGEEKGMYYQAADRITQYLDEVRKIDGLETISLSVRFVEMHLKKFYDLLDNRTECFVREDENGIIQFRGNGLNRKQQRAMYENGNENKLQEKEIVLERLKGKTLEYMCCKTVDEVEKVVAKGMKYRQVGTSTIHNQSSRSHAFMEIEIVTDELLKVRENILNLKAEVDYYTVDVNWTKCRTAELALAKEKKYLKTLTQKLKSLHPCIGGMLVFVDLAGAENGKDIGFESKQRTSIEEQEGKQINMSLMSLNEVMRKIQKTGSKISWRGSYLTQAMKRYLEAKNSISTIMCNVACSVLHEKKTKSTLYYASQMIQKTNSIHKKK